MDTYTDEKPFPQTEEPPKEEPVVAEKVNVDVNYPFLELD
ncbi:hypothetical protein UFOVP380_48 [uncultured Caudovirales phage]|uniref:Uncharacterized protein n=1 Tax=uncultured Caudovirales phage TaxID=2100421 RepID=A0A6J7X7X0_9CAUD|nr:hypothetical protein UFOVP380_48 [uncultured Caudovirales phage]